ncbi:MAG: hypothetical protein KC933_19510 [Myxococcales bacterium]|nr:hypothetical protein [Myxococcales bacterium]
MITTLTLTALATLAPAAPADAPIRLITEHGVELRADEQVFVLFAALNAAGYSEESNRKGPPLRAPVFHEIRVDVRDELRKAKDVPSMAQVRKLFESNPGEIEDYLAAVLGRDDKAKLSKAAQALLPKVNPVLDAFREEAKLTALFDKVAEEQRDHAKALKALVEKDFVEARKITGDADLRGPKSLVVVPNPLDGHAMVRTVDIGDTRYLVVGPGSESARSAILAAALRPTMLQLAKQAYPRAKGFKRSWDGLKTSRRITSRYPDGADYLAEALTVALAQRVSQAGKADTREADEDFIDEQARQGMRWARAALKILEKHDGKTSLAEELPKLVDKISP